MEMTIEQIDGVTVVVVPGKELDAGNTEQFKSAIKPVSLSTRCCSPI